MGKEYTDLTWEDLCNLMCGTPEDDCEEEGGDENDYMSLQKDDSNENY